MDASTRVVPSRRCVQIIASWWFFSTHLKNMQKSNWSKFPQFSGWKCQKSLKTATTWTCIAINQLPKFIFGQIMGVFHVTPFELLPPPGTIFRSILQPQVESNAQPLRWHSDAHPLLTFRAWLHWRWFSSSYLGFGGSKKNRPKGKTCSWKKVDFLIGEIGELENSWRFSMLKYIEAPKTWMVS